MEIRLNTVAVQSMTMALLIANATLLISSKGCEAKMNKTNKFNYISVFSLRPVQFYLFLPTLKLNGLNLLNVLSKTLLKSNLHDILVHKL